MRRQISTISSITTASQQEMAFPSMRKVGSYTVNPEIFATILIFANSVKRHTFDWKISRQGYDSPISVVERVISPFCEDFIFTKLRICEVS